MPDYDVTIKVAMRVNADSMEQAERKVLLQIQKLKPLPIQTEIITTIKRLRTLVLETNVFGWTKEDLHMLTTYDLTILDLCRKPIAFPDLVEQMDKVKPMFQNERVVAESVEKLMSRALLSVKV